MFRVYYLSVFLKWAKPGLFFVYFRRFLIKISIIQIEKSIGIRTIGLRMVGADNTMVLWWPPILFECFVALCSYQWTVFPFLFNKD